MRREYDFSKGTRGPVMATPSGKTRITIRLDDDIVAWFRAQVHAAGGGNYQTLINDALREFMASRREPLEDTLRRVLQEEWARYGSRISSGSARTVARSNDAARRTRRSLSGHPEVGLASRPTGPRE
jgi:hypothetical protein